jgi:hypothetical protein
MRYAKFLSSVAAVLFLLSAGLAMAGPGERYATSKALGDYQGRILPRTLNRSYSYTPGNGTWTPSAPGTNAQQTPAAPATAANQDSSTRSFSYQGQGSAPSGNAAWGYYRQAPKSPGFYRADRKALGEY